MEAFIAVRPSMFAEITAGAVGRPCLFDVDILMCGGRIVENLTDVLLTSRVATNTLLP